MIRALCLALSGFALLAQVPDLDKLPEWAVSAARASLAEPPPAEAEAWVLLQKTEFIYAGAGEIRERQYRLVRILGERGLREGVFVLVGLGGRTNRIKTLKGWNLRPDGELEKLTADEVGTLGMDAPDVTFSTQVLTAARLPRVTKGSFVAFESTQIIRSPQGPVAFSQVLESNPIRQWEMGLALAKGWFTDPKVAGLKLEARNLEPWAPEKSVTPTALLLRNLPARPVAEGLRPFAEDAEPMVYVTFQDLAWAEQPSMETWDWLAIRTWKAHASHYTSIEPVPLAGKAPRPGLEALGRWMARELSYQAVYLSPERGWVPEGSAEVCRRRFGDCKDLASCFAGGALALGLKPYPVLARIFAGHVPADHPVTPCAFNHVIAAVALKDSLGLPSEVETPAGRFLLVDPTSRLTPVGQLPAAHRGRRVLICTETRGLWVEVPEAAIEPEALEVELRGALSPEGRLEATLKVIETGNCQGLRQAALAGTQRSLRERLAAVLSLHGDATLEVLEVSEALDLERPLTLQARLVLPKGLTPAWGEWSLQPVGLPPLPAMAQKAGKPRGYPVSAPGHFRWTWRVALDLPPNLVSRALNRRLATPFREAEWQGGLERSRFQGVLTMNRKDADFAFGQREEGVREALKDLGQLKVLEEEILTFAAPKP